MNDHPGGGFDFSGIGSIFQPDKGAEEAVIPVGGRNSDPAVLLLRKEGLDAIEVKAAVAGQVLHYRGYFCVVGMEHPDGLAHHVRFAEQCLRGGLGEYNSIGFAKRLVRVPLQQRELKNIQEIGLLPKSSAQFQWSCRRPSADIGPAPRLLPHIRFRGYPF